MKLTEGQTLIYAYYQYVANGTLTVGKVRRKYADVVENEALRIDMETMRVEYTHNGRWAGWCYLSTEDMEAQKAAELESRAGTFLWEQLHRKLPYQKPDGMAVETIREVAQTLGFQLPELPPWCLEIQPLR